MHTFRLRVTAYLEVCVAAQLDHNNVVKSIECPAACGLGLAVDVSLLGNSPLEQHAASVAAAAAAVQCCTRCEQNRQNRACTWRLRLHFAGVCQGSALCTRGNGPGLYNLMEATADTHLARVQRPRNIHAPCAAESSRHGPSKAAAGAQHGQYPQQPYERGCGCEQQLVDECSDVELSCGQASMTGRGRSSQHNTVKQSVSGQAVAGGCSTAVVPLSVAQL